MPSQYGEHKRILEYFQGFTGRFLDVGSFDGITFSNTHCLADLGWSGVCLEPSPPAFCWLMKNYQGNTRVELVNAALASSSERVVPFSINTSDAVSADMLSTLSPAHKARFAMHPWRDIRIPTIAWHELFEACPPPYDFINIDVEGTNEALLNSLLISPAWPRMISIEVDPLERRAAMGLTLTAMGFTASEMIGGNLLAWRSI